jgi:integrase
MTNNKINFTKTAIEELPIPETGRVTYRDEKTAGLQLRVSASGLKVFSFYKRVKGGEPERVTLGRFPAVTAQAAREEAKRLAGVVSAGENPAGALRKLRGELTVTEFFNDEYLPRYGNGKKSVKADIQRFSTYLQPAIGKKRLSAVTRGDIASVLSAADKAGKAGSTVNSIKALAGSIFRKAVEYDLLDAIPTIGLSMRKTRERDRFLSSEELGRFFDAVFQEPNETMRDFVLMAVLTGARRANLMAMRWADIDIREKTWRIPETKNGKPQTVVLSEEATAVLEGRQRAGEWVFPSESSASGHIAEPKDTFKRIMARAGIATGRDIENGATLHDLRRTLASWQAKGNSSMIVIGKTLGHLSTAATKIYARLDNDPVRESVQAATKAMFSAVNTGGAGAIILPITSAKKTA